MDKPSRDSLIDTFEAEAKSHIEIIESAFNNTDKFAADTGLIDEVFRAAHSLKGTAGFFSYENVVAVAHELENIFAALKDGRIVLDEEITDIVLQTVDYLTDLLENHDNPEAASTTLLTKQLKSYSHINEQAKETISDLPFEVNEPKLLSAMKKALERGQFIYHLNIEFNKNLGKYYQYPKVLIDEVLSVSVISKAAINGLITENTDIAELLSSKSSAVLDLIVFCVLEPKLFSLAIDIDSKYIHILSDEMLKEEKPIPAEPAAAEEESAAKVSLQKQDFSIRLDVSSVNTLLDLANEMILTRNQLIAKLPQNKTHTSFKPLLNDLSRLTKEMQERIMNTRMQPISLLFAKFPRMIRRMANDLGKDIKMEIYGGEVTLDRYMIDALSDPLTQLIKNSADHGIESVERRIAAAKPRTGIILLRAYRSENMAIIEVEDDGVGIDEEGLKKKSLELGRISEEELDIMTRDEIFELMFLPGISTAKEITNISGRGVGMDIVKINIEKMGGSIEIVSEQEKGTLTRLKVPLTLSVIRALIIKIDGITYAVPEVNVERIIRVSKDKETANIENIGGAYFLNIGGWLLPFVTLVAKKISFRGDNIVKCIVLRTENKYFALLIDTALGTEETLVKPLPVFLKNCRSYASVSILGSGDTVMVLDAAGLLYLSGIDGADKKEEVSAETGGDERSVLIFTCSGKERFAIEESGVAKIVRIAPKQIQEIGDKLFVNIAGRTVQIIRPEDHLPVKKLDYQKEWLYILLLSNAVLPMGLLVGRVLTKASAAFELDNEHFESKYLLGSSYYEDRIILFLNMREFLDLV